MTVTEQVKPPYFSAPASEWKRAVGFLLLCSLLGLKFYPAFIFVALLLIKRFRTDRYFFLVEFVIFCSGSGLIRYDALPLRPYDIAFLFGIVGMLIYRRYGLIRKITYAMLAYFAVLFGLALSSTESLMSQIPQIRYYLLIIGFFIPLVTFANRDFDFQRFLHVLTVHVIALCGFYVVDTFIFSGAILLPGAEAWAVSSITSPVFAPFSFSFPRHYPPGLYWFVVLIIPITYKQMRFRWYHWALIVGAIAASRTNSLLFALAVCFIFFRPKLRQVVIYSVIGVVAISGLYFVDKSTGGNLRLADNIEQFTSLSKAADNEDLAEFGTGRMAQILPKWELLYDLNRQWLGFGFLSPTKTTNPVYQITNEYYTDISKSEETATGVEVTEVQTILDIGFLGLILQLAFYVGVYFMIKRLPYSNYYLCTLVGMEVLGIGGFAGLNGMHASLLILGLVLGAIILNDKTARERRQSNQIQHIGQ